MAAKERRNCMRGTEASVVEAILTLLEEGSHYGTDAQHKLYFMAELSGESFGHEPHLYGPHSSMVSNQLGALVAAGLVDERVSANLHPPLEYGPLYPKWYRLSEDGAVTNAARPESLQRYERQARAVCGSGAVADVVAVAAKAHFRTAYSSGPRVGVTAVRSAIGELGLCISDRTAEEAVDYLRSIDLAVNAPETEGGAGRPTP